MNKLRNHSYEHICGCGPNGSILHYVSDDQELKDGQLILMGMGGLAAGYLSYVTITVLINGNFTNKRIYDIVLNANLEIQNNAKIGVGWTDEVEK